MGMIREKIVQELLSWPDVTVQPHRFGGVEFLFRGREIGHMHGEQIVDILFPMPIRNQLATDGRAKPHHMFPESGWITFYIDGPDHIQSAIELLRVQYDRFKAKKGW